MEIKINLQYAYKILTNDIYIYTLYYERDQISLSWMKLIILLIRLVTYKPHILKTCCEIIFFNTVQVGKKESLNPEIQYMECT